MFSKVLNHGIIKRENVPHELIDLAKILGQDIGSVSSFSHACKLHLKTDEAQKELPFSHITWKKYKGFRAFWHKAKSFFTVPVSADGKNKIIQCLY